ncbi:MAG: AMP-binding protein, partial [Actinomycetota bacterium]|nr:AMP-binding protein [Actinomycetota bacterium]
MPAATDRPLVALQLPGLRLARALERCWADGEAVLPLPVDLPAAELRRVLAELRPQVLIDPSSTTALPAAEPVADDVRLVVTTAGSSGGPKGVELTAAALEAAARAGHERIGAGIGDRWLCCLPPSHVGGLMVLVRSRLVGVPAVVHERFDPAAVASTPDASLVSLVPTMLWRLLDVGVDLSRFRCILLGGAPAPRALLARARATG